MGRRWVTAYVLAMAGVAAGWFGPIQILLPAQAGHLAGPEGKEALLALVTGYGAAASLAANPLWGAVSDRLRSRWGRRRPVFVAGTGVGVLGLLVLSDATSATGMMTGWILVQVGLNGPLAALAALLGDRVPDAQRGTVGALFGVAQIAGVVLGTAVAVALGEGALGYAALAVAVPALAVSLLLVHREPAAYRPPPEARARTSRRAVLLRPGGQFGWAWLIRFLLNLVNALVLLYLYYYLDDAVGAGDPGTLVLAVTLLNVTVAGVCAAAGGVLSDRLRRRRAFIAAGAGLLACGAVLMALLPAVPAVLAAAVLVGAGWGSFVAVDMAVITQVLPGEESRATMLGIANIAGTLPQLLAPVLAAPLVTRLGGYRTLYLVTAAVALLALACLPRLRDVTRPPATPGT
ncbi:MFS transporter [Streptomyces fradiae]|uniref:MFS transporter n=1 Tax=Streptomyces fradiae TaxID=1906 RepID=A0ACC4W2V7_STRFR|nr:MFS transporter [Streptomyces fradiae]